MVKDVVVGNEKSPLQSPLQSSQSSYVSNDEIRNEESSSESSFVPDDGVENETIKNRRGMSLLLTLL